MKVYQRERQPDRMPTTDAKLGQTPMSTPATSLLIVPQQRILAVLGFAAVFIGLILPGREVGADP